MPNVPLSITNWALKVHKGVEIQLRSIAIYIFRITRSVCSSDLSVCVFGLSTTVTLRCACTGSQQRHGQVLQYKATVWPKVAPNFLGEHPPDPPSCFCISVLQATKSWAGPGHEVTGKHNVPTLCPGIDCALAMPLGYSCM